MSGVGDEAEIGFVVFIQRSGDADDDGVHLLDTGIVAGGRKALRLGGLDLLRRDTVDVGTALGEGIDLAGVDVEAGYGKIFFAIQQSQGKADVSQADDAHAGLMLLDSGVELFQRCICGRERRHEVIQYKAQCRA